jgi:two-component system NtrC family response regulator
LREDEFDVAIVDIGMTPEMDGIEMIRQAYDAGVNTDMVILTGHGERADAVAAIKIGVNDWFDKTNIDMDKFFQRVKELAEGVPLDRIERILSVIED